MPASTTSAAGRCRDRNRNDRTADTNVSTHGSKGRHHHECTHRTGRHRSTPTLQVRRRRGGGRSRRRLGDKLLAAVLVVGGAAENHMATIQPDRYMFLGGTDGWIGLPPTPAIPPFHPDTLAPTRARPDDLHLRVPQHHRARRGHRFAQKNRRSTAHRCSGSSSSTTTWPPSSSSTSPTSGWLCAPTCSTPTPSTGTGSAT